MIRLPFVHPESSHATAVTIAAGELHLEPVRVLDGRWCVRRDHTVTDGVSQWKRLSVYLADRGLVAPGDRDALGGALRAAHWRRIAVPVERYRGRGSDSGVSATLARGTQQKEAA